MLHIFMFLLSYEPNNNKWHICSLVPKEKHLPGTCLIKVKCFIDTWQKNKCSNTTVSETATGLGSLYSVSSHSLQPLPGHHMSHEMLFCCLRVICVWWQSVWMFSSAQTSVMRGRVLRVSFQSCLKFGTEVGELLAAEGWRSHNPPGHPLEGAVLLIGHHINSDAPPEVHLICS